MKSDVSDYLELMEAVYRDATIKCTADVSDLRDLKTIRSRVEEEGLSFLTITLPTFCKDFERSLADGQVDSTRFRYFRKCGAIPAFLRGMLSRLFDVESGRILHEDDDFATVVEGVRQICLFLKKVEIGCSPEREAAAIANFEQVEQINSEFTLSDQQSRLFRDVADVLWTNMLADLQLDMLVPRHGPGATAERVSGNQKYVWREWYERLERSFPFYPNAYSMGVVDEEELKKVTFVPETEERPVRVVLVPKTLKSPRVIAIEPVCMQYAQQAVQAELYRRLETYWLTRGHVNFSDQTVNQRLALASSVDGRLATIDLSDASDRVLYTLASEMFRSNPDLWDLIDACRSRYALLPNGHIVGPLAKFASMGSALCFPVESMCFYTICVGALLVKHNLPVTARNVFDVTRRIYVYGDDIIVPADDAVTVLDHLKEHNCKVNDSKSFWTGRFRESCGVDAYGGALVTPVYLRQERPRSRQSAASVMSWTATANQFYLKGYWRTASLMFAHLERVCGEIPYISASENAVGRISFLGYRSANRWNPKLQRLEQRCWVPKSVYGSDNIDGNPALQKCLLSLEHRSRGETDIQDWGRRRDVNSIVSDPLHLERSARRGDVTLKLRWIPAQ